MKSLLVFAAMLAVAGCAAQSAAPDFSFAAADHQGKGLLAGSLTAEDAGNFFGQDVIIYFDPADPKSKLPRVRVLVNNHCKPGDVGIDIGKPCTEVFASVVPAGDYVFQEWYIQDAGGGTISPRHWQGPKVTVQAGKVLYVGGIDMVFDPNIPGAGPDDWHGWPHASDQSARDIPILLKRLPRIKADDIVAQSLSLAPPDHVCITGTVMMITTTRCGD